MQNNAKKPTIIFSGGGTLGPVTPLLAIAEEWKEQEPIECVWVGTRKGVERALVETMHIPFVSIPCARFDRDRPWLWWLIPFSFLRGCIAAWRILRKVQPDLVMSAGGYVSVPIVWMARLRKIPSWIHQLDMVPGLANRLMAPFATRISVTWPESLEEFPKHKTVIVGGAMRKALLHGNREQAATRHGLHTDAPTVLVMGGGTGAASINHIMEAIGTDLLEQGIQILHLTGKGKMTPTLAHMGDGYVAVEFLGLGMKDFFAMADVVVARAGMGTIIELSALKKPTIFLPLPNTDQLSNAKKIEEREAGEVLYQANPQMLKGHIERLMRDADKRRRLSSRISALFSAFGAQDIIHHSRNLLRKEKTIE